MAKNDGGPAFTKEELDELQREVREAAHIGVPSPIGQHVTTASNMPLRDWFAGQAVISLSYNLSYEEWQSCWKEPPVAAREMARHSYMLADAMLAERDKG